jgi:hypothetical protein
MDMVFADEVFQTGYGEKARQLKEMKQGAQMRYRILRIEGVKWDLLVKLLTTGSDPAAMSPP